MEVHRVMYMVFVEDMDRAVRFYADVIGFRRRSMSPRWSELAFGDFTLALHAHTGNESEKNYSGLSITVADVDSACAEVAAGGGKVINPPQESDFEGLKVALVADPDGNSMEIGEYST